LSSGSLERRFFHCDAAVLNHSVLHMSEEQRCDVLTIGIENHVSGNTFVRFCSGQSVPDPSFIQARTANGVKQKPHRIIGQGGEVIRLFFITRFVASVDFQPARISAARIVRKNCLKAVSCRSRATSI
jgi:hypothetical protein